MASKKNIEEIAQELVVIEEFVDQALDKPMTAEEFLRRSMLEDEQVISEQTTKTIRIPRMFLPLSGKAFSDKGHLNGYVLDRQDGSDVEVNITQLRVGRVGAFIPSRTMWPFDDKGVKIVKAGTKPACASSDGVSARKSDVFGYIGQQIKDWRTKRDVTILEDNCSKCSFRYSPYGTVLDEMGEPEVIKNANGKFVTRTEPGPCQETPTFILYDFDRKSLLLYQAANYTAAVHIVGKPKSKWGFLKGFDAYYATDEGKKASDVNPEPNVWYSVVMGSKMAQTNNGFFPAPTFKLGEQLSEQEMDEFATVRMLYKQDNIRDIITGAAWVDFESDEFERETSGATEERPF